MMMLSACFYRISSFVQLGAVLCFQQTKIVGGADFVSSGGESSWFLSADDVEDLPPKNLKKLQR